MEEKLIKECPVCHGKNLVQDSEHQPFTMHTVIGQRIPHWRDGCHCEDCGSKFVFNHVTENEFRKPERDADAREFAEMCGRLPVFSKKITKIETPEDVKKEIKKAMERKDKK
jgi:hypothetical protein